MGTHEHARSYSKRLPEQAQLSVDSSPTTSLADGNVRYVGSSTKGTIFKKIVYISLRRVVPDECEEIC